MKSSTRCHPILSNVKVLLSPLPSGVVLTDKEVEIAFLHVRRCTSCKGALTPEEYTAFVSRVLLENE